MPRSVIAYDRDLPEIPDRCPWLPPDSHLVKDKNSPTGWQVAPGRRRNDLLLVNGQSFDPFLEQGCVKVDNQRYFPPGTGGLSRPPLRRPKRAPFVR